jgi:photosystem II stability/assembly factor-like uncharacterized protein
MQLRRSILLAILIILFIYFEIHSCSEDRLIEPNGPNPESTDLICKAHKVFFIDHDTGWVLGKLGTMMRTTDGGETWHGTVIPDASLNGVFFLDRNRGWIVGKAGKIYRSFDGGVMWERTIFSGEPQGTDLYDIQFLNDMVGFVLGYAGVYRTADAGMLWKNYWLPVIPNKGAWNMSLIDDCLGYLLGSSWMDPDPELVYKTEDGGLSWHPVEGSESSVLRAVMTIEFIDDNTGWAGGGIIMKTVDSGRSWTIQREESTVREFHFCSPSYGFAVGGMTILRTQDGGDSWDDVTPDDGRIMDLRSACFIDENYGFVVGRGPEEPRGSRLYVSSFVLRTTDGGETWDTEEFLYDYTEFRALE